MRRSFGLVDAKVFEADFFLDKLSNYETGLFAVRCYFNAFVSAARSVTYSMQAVMHDIKDFKEWYAGWQKLLRQDDLARFFHDTRNEIHHVGENFVRGAIFEIEDGQLIGRYYFDQPIDIGETDDPVGQNSIPAEDIVAACTKYLVLLVEMVFDCYTKFGQIIDPEEYYTVRNLGALGLTVEDVEELLGYPRRWTEIEGVDASTRLEYLRSSIPGTEVDVIFLKYLGKCRGPAQDRVP